MALIVCPECGRDISDKASVCPHCGYPISNIVNSNGTTENSNSQASAENLPKEPQKEKKKIGIFRIITVIFAIFLLIKGISDLSSGISQPSASTPTVSKQTIINAASDFEYENLIRFPEENEGEYLVIKVRVEQIFDSFGVQYYRAYTDNDGYNIYLGDELILTDSRSSNTTKIIEDDIITIYGRFVGLEKFERALGNVKVEIPLVEMLYVDFDDENIPSTQEDDSDNSQTVESTPKNESPSPVNSDAAPESSSDSNGVKSDNNSSTNNGEAKKQAQQYLSFLAYSRNGLIEQLESEGFSHDEAVQGVDSCSTDWNNQALRSANTYLNILAFSYNGLLKQLESDGFTSEQAQYGVNNCGANWNEQALKAAKTYLNVLAFSYSGLLKQVKSDGFTSEQAQYGVNNCGANWNEQAARSAQSILSLGIFNYTKSELIDQLEGDGFTHEQAVYGAQQNGY